MKTNFFRINIPAESFQIQRVPYREETLTQLRVAHNRNASFFRNGDHIYISPWKGFEEQLGELVELKVDEAPSVVLSLIRHSVFRTFRDEFPKRIPQAFSPLRFFSLQPDHDPIKALLPAELQTVLSYPRLIEVEARQIVENNHASFGLLIRSRQRWQLYASLTQLYAEGFDLIGKSVLETHPIPGLIGVMAPDETLLGQIVSLNQDKATLLTNSGTINKSLSLLQLQRTPSQIGSYLDFKLGKPKTTKIFEHLREDQRSRSDPGVTFKEITRFASWFSKVKDVSRIYANSDGFCFTVSGNNSFDGASVPISPTNLSFSYGPGATSQTPLSGLRKYGPFKAEQFGKNDLRMLVVYHPEDRGAVTQFLKQLIEGIPESQYFQSGLKNLFRLTSVTPILKEVKSRSPEGFENSIDEAIKDQEGRSFDIALVESAASFKSYHPKDNPYYRARARLMSLGIPTQGVRDQHLRSSPGTLEYTLGPMALQIYAKVGGTPWRLPASQSIDREIIVGIGNSLERPNLWSGAEQSRIVGITTFFLGDGSYVLGERTQSVPFQNYFSELLHTLKTSISRVAKEYAWQVNDTVRIVFHVFKPLKNIEVDVVTQLISSFPEYEILFAFVTISADHPWIVFRNAYSSNDRTIVTTCERGDNLILDPDSCLLQLRGSSHRPNKKQRSPYPMLIRVHPKSTYKDLKFIAQQIHDFSYLSWRSFFPAEKPVTLFYSDLMVLESNRLNIIPGWNPSILENFRRKQWFL